MKQYEIRTGLNAGLNGARTDKRSAMGIAIGHADIKWKLLLDPDFCPSGVPYDRVNGKATVSSIPIPRGTFPNGAAAFNLISNTQVQPNVAFNNSEWSMFWTCRLSSAISGQLARTITATPGVFSPRISFTSSATSFGIYQGDTPTFRSVASEPASFVDLTTYFMITFSQVNGLRVYRNGAIADTDAGETAPFAMGFNAGEWQMFNAMRGPVGICGLTDTDLSAAAMAPRRAAIDTFMKTKYGIA